MATIVKLATGYQAKVRIKGVSKSKVFKTKLEAQTWAQREEANIIAQAAGNIPNKTFGELLERYINEIIPAKRGSREDTLRMARIQKDEMLAGTPLVELNAKHFAEWRDRRLKQVSGSTVNRELSSMSHACTVAMKEWRWLNSNPLSLVTRPAEPKARTRRLSDDEITRLLLASGYDADLPPLTVSARVGAAMLFAIETAMRAGEICGIRWEHIDFNRRIIFLPMTKNGHSREVPLSREAMRIIQQLQNIAIEEKPVFQVTAASLEALFRRFRYAVMIEDLHFHDTRREALTRLAAKVDVMTLAKISGHRDLRILQNTYYAPDMSLVVDKLD